MKEVNRNILKYKVHNKVLDFSPMFAVTQLARRNCPDQFASLTISYNFLNKPAYSNNPIFSDIVDTGQGEIKRTLKRTFPNHSAHM